MLGFLFLEESVLIQDGGFTWEAEERSVLRRYVHNLPHKLHTFFMDAFRILPQISWAVRQMFYDLMHISEIQIDTFLFQSIWL